MIGGVTRHTDRERVSQAKLTGAAARLRDLATTNPQAFEELRRVWPEIAEQLGYVVELVDWERSASAES